ncbi:unnamed protein product [Orchesella dallaii]|uniref:Gustatory receptor n=1 Tax=Orchesella dallaii TaxID=48710 RepID=A0ABP1RHC6_9HEXA
MLIYENIIKNLRDHLKQQRIYGTSPVITNKNSNFVRTTGHGMGARFIQKLKTSISLINTIILWIQFFHEIGKVKQVTTARNLLFAVAMTTLYFVHWIVHKQGESIAELYNMFLRFEERYEKEFQIPNLLTKGEKRLVQFCIKNAYQGVPPTAMLYSSQRWFAPCNSATVGYVFMPECKNNMGHHVKWGIPSQISLALVCIVSFWINLDALGNYVYYNNTLSFSWSYSLCVYIKLFREDAVAKLRNGDRSGLLMYRELQLLCRYYNCIQQDALMGAYIFLVVNIFVIGNYVLIAMGGNIALNELFMFVLVSIQQFLYIYVYFGVFARVNTDSEEVIKSVKQRGVVLVKQERMRRWATKYVRSLQPLKVNIGTNDIIY